MPFTIEVEKPKNLQTMLSKLKSDAKKYKVSFEGNDKLGRGSAYGFDGTYAVDEDVITIRVLKKPLFISGSRIEKEVRKYFSHSEY